MKFQTKVKLNQKALMILSAFFFLTILSSCDFTSPIRKKILTAQSYIFEKRYEQAIRKFEDILIEKPQKEIATKIYYQIGEIYSLHLKQYSKAIEYFKKVKTYTNDPLWLVKSEEKLAEIHYYFQRNFKESARNFDRLYQFRPKLEKADEYQFMYSRSLLKTGRYSKAYKSFKRISETRSHEYAIRSLFFLGKIKFLKKDWKEAVKLWLDYLSFEKKSNYIVETKFLMANSYESLEELRKAYNIYYSLLTKYPNKKIIKSRLDSVYARRVARKR